MVSGSEDDTRGGFRASDERCCALLFAASFVGRCLCGWPASRSGVCLRLAMGNLLRQLLIIYRSSRAWRVLVNGLSVPRRFRKPNAIVNRGAQLWSIVRL